MVEMTRAAEVNDSCTRKGPPKYYVSITADWRRSEQNPVTTAESFVLGVNVYCNLSPLKQKPDISGC